jgi:hypothetical protein
MTAANARTARPRSSAPAGSLIACAMTRCRRDRDDGVEACQPLAPPTLRQAHESGRLSGLIGQRQLEVGAAPAQPSSTSPGCLLQRTQSSLSRFSNNVRIPTLNLFASISAQNSCASSRQFARHDNNDRSERAAALAMVVTRIGSRSPFHAGKVRTRARRGEKGCGTVASDVDFR